MTILKEKQKYEKYEISEALNDSLKWWHKWNVEFQ